MRKILLFVILLMSIKASAQKIYGTVFNSKGDLLPYSSITIKNTTIGASANNRAKFAINLTPGTYTVVCQHIGYATQEKTFTISTGDKEAAFILTEQKLVMKEVVVKSNGEDPAYQIIREAIKKRSFYFKQVNAFTCDLYGKDMIKLRRLPNKILGKKIPDADVQEMMLDTLGMGIIYLSESVGKVAIQQPDKFKMQVISSRVSGSSGFGFSFPTFITLYQNNVSIFAEQLNPRGFVSPIADGAIRFYKFKFLGSFWENGKEINSIRVTPRREYEPLFSGIINITENDWRIHSFDLLLTKKAQLEIIDTLQITQFHVPVNDEVWRVKNQLLHFNFNQFGIDAVGNFVNVYSSYNVAPDFNKGYFDRVIIKYDTNVNKKSKAYWDTIRPVPLEKEEIKDYLVKDSMFTKYKVAATSKLAIDSLNKKQGKLKLYNVFWNGINRTHYSTINTYDWGINSLIKNLEYNTAEGIALNVSGYYEKELKKSKVNLSLKPTIRYGFNNSHLNAWADIILRARDIEIDKKIKREEWAFSGGKRVSQFNKESPITPLVNSFSTILYGDNFMKTYENYFVGTAFTKKYESGFRINIKGLYEDRIPLNNTTNFTVFKKDSINITPNYPYEKISDQFTRHQAIIVSVDISFKPGQKFIQFPYQKIPIGSKYPTFSFNYTKGIKNIFASDVNFDKWKLNVAGDNNLKLGGVLKYNLGMGGFLNSKIVFIQDYQHFNGNRSTLAADYLNSFQLSSYYANSTLSSFYAIMHLEHHLNGLLTNKIPYFNRLNWNLVAGTNTFFINQRTNHVELFIGLENILKIFRIDFITAFENGGRTRNSAISIGFGGLLGGSINKAFNNSDKANGF
ncbi:MAG: carboxypeptidase-like regulatory domain-containing protein [Ferruginibacter sp.]|nr:carboxypeptidase-like regulatory domain-containing protein [Ferruginibacter sp.]